MSSWSAYPTLVMAGLDPLDTPQITLVSSNLGDDGIQDSSAHVTLADSDGDSIPDYLDECPDDPENINGIDDDDGCPDSVPNRPPVASISESTITATAGSTVTLDGSASHDPDGDSLEYSWVRTDENASIIIELANSDTHTASFAAPDVSESVRLKFELTVTEADTENQLSDTDTVTVFVVPVLNVEEPLVTAYSPVSQSFSNFGQNIEAFGSSMDMVLVSAHRITAEIDDARSASGKPATYHIMLGSDGTSALAYHDSYSYPKYHTSDPAFEIADVYHVDDNTTVGNESLLDALSDIRDGSSSAAPDDGKLAMMLNKATGRGIIADGSGSIYATVTVNGAVYLYSPDSASPVSVFGNPAGAKPDHFGREVTAVNSTAFVSCAPRYSEDSGPRYGACYIIDTRDPDGSVRIHNPDTQTFGLEFGGAVDATPNWIAISDNTSDKIAIFDSEGIHSHTVTSWSGPHKMRALFA